MVALPTLVFTGLKNNIDRSYFPQMIQKKAHYLFLIIAFILAAGFHMVSLILFPAFIFGVARVGSFFKIFFISTK